MKVYTYFKHLTIIILTLMLWFYSAALASPNSSVEKITLEGKSFQGKIKAKGFLGFFKVAGTLSFQDNYLIWQVEDEVNKGLYKVTPKNGLIHFSAHVKMTNGESVDWQGYYNGSSLIQVNVMWTRVEGDFIHDLFLPPVVTMEFIPQ